MDLKAQDIDPCAFISHFKLVSHALNSSYTIYPQFLPYFPDMYINGTVAYNYIVTPNLREDLIAQENTARAGSQ